MSTDRSAYATLGLEPGADAAAIDRAYKRLIKQFHPDRQGGDALRAAEINRAYRELRDLQGLKDALLFRDDTALPSRRWRAAAAFAGAGAILIAFAAGSIFNTGAEAPRVPAEVAEAETPPLAGNPQLLLDGPINDESVAAAVQQAQEIASDGDEMAMTAASRDCHFEMRRSPSLAQLDRCAAFDDAVILLQDRDPLRDGGPFSELAVTGRQMSSATLLSSDYLEIDGRLDRIRLKVELALAPAEPPLPPIEDLAESTVSEP